MGRGRGFRGLVTALIAFGTLAFAPGAEAAFPDDVFDGAVDCTVESDGVRFCGGNDTTVKAFDEVPIDVNVAFPPAPTRGPDGDFPLIGIFHGWGGSESSLGGMRRFLDQGYAVFSMSDRGWGRSCSQTDPKFLNPTSGCIDGYNRLMDTRYEVRDAQDFFATLVDEGAVDPARIGSSGGSYGGGLSMALAALKDRQMMPDGTLVPWVSPEGTPMSLAAAIPEIPWTDLAYSLVPNGGTLDYVADADYFKPDQFGVMKESFVSGLYAVGRSTSNFESGADMDAAVDAWYTRLTTGEPYDGDPTAEDIAEEVTAHHSSYYIDNDSTEPAPIFISNGWTDDLFPADEAIRFYNKTRVTYPDADISMMFLDYGHQRGQNKSADVDLLHDREDAWLAHYVKQDTSPKPPNQVETLTQTCPKANASGGPFTAPTWRELSPGEIVFRGDATQTILPSAANTSGASFDPIAGGGACATTSSADEEGIATYRLDPAPAGGYTLMGSPTIIADILSTSPNNQLAYRLLDADPSADEQTLVARGLYRPDDNLTSATRQVFQAHPNGYKFAEGHVAKLELRPSDAPYSRPSNAQGPMTVANLELRLPVLEEPDASLVREPAPKVVPEGYELAPGYGAAASQDSDGDGIADGEDGCPSQSGPASNDGCPDGSESTDSDGDGVPDQNDGCPNQAGPASNVGCAEGSDPDAGGTGGGGSDDGRDPFAPARCQTTLLSADSTTAGTDEGETMIGTSGDDILNGNGGRDTVVGLAGDDCLTGDDGFDTIRGKSGDDVATGGSGRDFMKGNAGDDYFEGGGGKDRIRLAGGEDVGKGGEGNDNVSTGGGDDKINGGAGNDRLFGNEGDDKIRGGKGKDVLFGGGGKRNVLNGGPGKDRCIVSSRANNKTKSCEKVLVGGARG